MNNLSPHEQLAHLEQGVQHLVSRNELLAKLQHSHKTKAPLRIKAGFDPSRADLHLGHAVLINKLRQFQLLGHEVIFLIGDFTAMIGDPTGKNEMRPTLTRNEVQKNAQTYATQVYKILDSNKTTVTYNSKWLDALSSEEFVRLSSRFTVARMLERDDFSQRYKAQTSIGVHEFLYPLMQAYDSVALKADIECGGSDQYFNLLLGRDIQKAYGQASQCVLTVPLLEGLDGVQKMSKSLGNHIAFEDSAKDIFGKTMRLSDELMLRYYELLTDLKPADFEKLKSDLKSGARHPRDAKRWLARFFTDRFCGQGEGLKAQSEFDRVFTQKGVPDKVPEHSLPPGSYALQALMMQLGLSPSKSQARRLIEGGGVSVEGSKVADANLHLDLKAQQSVLLKVGKKNFIKIKGV